jgi:hypothetical protein
MPELFANAAALHVVAQQQSSFPYFPRLDTFSPLRDYPCLLPSRRTPLYFLAPGFSFAT